MAAVYANLIVKGKKTLSDVPAKIREEVKALLIDSGHADLTEGEGDN